MVQVRMTEAELAQLDRLARRNACGRSDAIRIALALLEPARLASLAMESASPGVVSERLEDIVVAYRHAAGQVIPPDEDPDTTPE